jgi:hypothetical protein
MNFKELDTVVLIRDLPANGLREGDLGAVVDTHDPDALDVEFVTASGRTQALVTLHESDVRGVMDEDLATWRMTCSTDWIGYRGRPLGPLLGHAPTCSKAW